LPLPMSTTSSTTALSILPTYKRPCACAPALTCHPNATVLIEQGPTIITTMKCRCRRLD
jgi:hypothetical protein